MPEDDDDILLSGWEQRYEDALAELSSTGRVVFEFHGVTVEVSYPELQSDR